MSKRYCQQEDSVLRQSRNGDLPVETRAHVDQCPACAASLEVDRALQAAAKRVPGLDDLPDPMAIWWRSRQQVRQSQVERATLPIVLAERAALVAGGAGFFIGLSVIWPAVRATAARWVEAWTTHLADAQMVNSTGALLALFFSVVLLAGFGLYSQWAED